jgi:anti-anti-sigma regulatory factor
MLNISISTEEGRVPVTVLQVTGQLDGQNYQELIAKARDLYKAGARALLLDMSGLTYISSAGLVALHAIALTMRGEAPPDPEQGWAAVKSADRSRQGGIQKHIKLLNPRPEVASVLDMVGFTTFFEIFSDRAKAVAAFA